MRSPRAFPQKISALISDVDGTLLTDDKTLTNRAQSAVAELRSRGIKFSIISSRPPRGLHMLFEPLRITTPLAGFNGGVLAYPNQEAIAEHLLTLETARRAVAILDAEAVQVWVFAGRDWLVRDRTGSHIEHEIHTVGFTPTVVDDFRQSLGAAAKIVGVSWDVGLLARSERDIRAVLGNQASVARSQPYYIDITHPLANKGVALTAIAKLLDIPLAQVVVIGDGTNDASMFERSGFSIAMGNSGSRVQRAADFVTSSNIDDGFAAAVERFLLDGRQASAQASTF
jgi:Cof subfamily protein (haloacid dehalogenase superfamily)